MTRLFGFFRMLVFAAAVSWSAATAQAATFMALPTLTDTDFNNLISSGQFIEDFIAEGRSGVPGPPDFELVIQDIIPPAVGPGSTVGPTAQFEWTNGMTESFRLVFDGTDITFDVGGTTLTRTNVGNVDVDTMYLRTRSNDEDSNVLESTVELSNLVVDGMSFAGSLLSQDGDTVNYLKVTDFGNTFIMTGTVNLAWTTPEIPRRSRLAFQIKVGNTPPVPPPPAVPEPASLLVWSVLGLGMLGYCRARRHIA